MRRSSLATALLLLVQADAACLSWASCSSSGNGASQSITNGGITYSYCCSGKMCSSASDCTQQPPPPWPAPPPSATSESRCSQNWCTSPDEHGGNDCFAGSDVEACTCSRGTAKQTGTQVHYEGKRYFEYTCCDGDYDYGARGAPEGDECGDYNPDHAVGAAIIGFVFVLVVICGLACGITGCCYGCPGCPWYPSWVEINGLVSLCSSFGQLALRRIRSAPDHASGRPRLRP